MCFPRRAHVLALALALHISPCDGVTFKLEPSHERCISETIEPRPPPSPTLGFPSDTVSQPMQRTVWIVAKDLPSDAEICRRAATAEHWRAYKAGLVTGVIDIKRSRKWSCGARPGIPERDEVLRRPRTYEIPKVVSSKSYIAADSFSTPVLLQDLTTYYLVLTTHYSLLTTHYLLLTTHYYLLLTTYDLLLQDLTDVAVKLERRVERRNRGPDPQLDLYLAGRPGGESWQGNAMLRAYVSAGRVNSAQRRVLLPEVRASTPQSRPTSVGPGALGGAGGGRRSNNALQRNLDDLRRARAGGCVLAGSASAPALGGGRGGSVGRSASFGGLGSSPSLMTLPSAKQGFSSAGFGGFSGAGFGGEAAEDQLARPSLRQQDTHSSLGGEGLSDEYIEGLAQRSITKSLVQRSAMGSPQSPGL